MRLRFSGPWAKTLRLVIAVLMTLALANFLLAQLKAMGDVASVVTGGIVPYEAGVIGLACVILFYETRGGCGRSPGRTRHRGSRCSSG